MEIKIYLDFEIFARIFAWRLTQYHHPGVFFLFGLQNAKNHFDVVSNSSGTVKVCENAVFTVREISYSFSSMHTLGSMAHFLRGILIFLLLKHSLGAAYFLIGFSFFS